MQLAEKKAITDELNAYIIHKSGTCCGCFCQPVYSGGTLRDMGAEVFLTAADSDLIGGKNYVL